ncbi:MAG: molybdenum cofactor biosynthesis protein MoaE [Flavobacteriales bacterium]|nr:molybdenum cofactor biosynthesis protein MoaE [Flavobacteriales bacterium]
MDIFRLEPHIISKELPEEWLRKDAHGGHVFFEGTVRGINNNRRVLQLEFEAYESMVFAELMRISKIIREKIDVPSLLLLHRTGVVKPGELAVLAGASSPHRAEAFQACEMLMNELKRSVPIWKKEFFEGGEVWVSAHP